MFGSGVLKGLGVTLKEFVATYVDDIKQIPSRYAGGKEEIDQSKASAQTGLFTVQYPEERRKLSERFRYIPMLIYEAETGEDRCTACGICAKVCPPQCIWIVRDKDENGKPITRPAQFNIDTSICMNCGLCAEFCPFDAIKMNNDYEIAAYRRMPSLVFDLKELRVPTTYYARIRPTDWAEEEAARKAKEAEKAAKPAPAERKGKGAEGPGSKPLATATIPATPTDVAARPAPARTPEEVERLKAEAAARRAAKATGEGGTSAAAAPIAPAAEAAVAPAKRTPEEIERLKAEAAARRAAKAGGETSAPAAEVTTPATAAEAPSGVGSRRTPEEIERLKAEAAARRAAKAGGEAAPVPAPVAEPQPAAVTEAAPTEPPAAQAAPPVAGVGARRTPEEIERLKAEAAARRAAKAGQSSEK